MVIISAYNGHRFCRGQLWLWHDPICGNKREGVSIPSEFERCVRYTRQVLVVQNMYTLSDRSVLVIPFSGHEHTTLYNIVCISDEGNTSYALPQLMFPADVNQLIKYIGVVDDAIMNSVDSVIQSILLPTGKPDFSEDPYIIIPSATSYNPQPKYVKPEPQNSQQEIYRPKKYDKKKFKKGGKRIVNTIVNISNIRVLILTMSWKRKIPIQMIVSCMIWSQITLLCNRKLRYSRQIM